MSRQPHRTTQSYYQDLANSVTKYHVEVDTEYRPIRVSRDTSFAGQNSRGEILAYGPHWRQCKDILAKELRFWEYGD